MRSDVDFPRLKRMSGSRASLADESDYDDDLIVHVPESSGRLNVAPSSFQIETVRDAPKGATDRRTLPRQRALRIVWLRASTHSAY